MTDIGDLLFRETLRVSVKIQINNFIRMGGPSESDIAKARNHQVFWAENPQRIDSLIRNEPKKAGNSAEIFNQVAFSVAVLSFAPGGIDFGNFHFEAALCAGYESEMSLEQLAVSTKE